MVRIGCSDIHIRAITSFFCLVTLSMSAEEPKEPMPCPPLQHAHDGPSSPYPTRTTHPQDYRLWASCPAFFCFLAAMTHGSRSCLPSSA
ncbi:hypothetical protein MY11210_007594 [Beauveria gryllotalpidicola]